MFPIRRVLALSVLALACAQSASPARAAESYDNCTGFIDSLPATVTTQGVWCLRQHLATSITGGNAVTIAANNVTLDCNDFKIGGLAAGNSSSAVGVRGMDRLNAVVRNCGIRGFLRGVYFTGGGGHQIEGNRFDQNLYVSIHMDGEDNLVRDNRIFDTGGTTQYTNAFGIYGNTDVIGNEVSGVYASSAGAIGINVYGAGALVSGNRVRRLIPGNGHTALGLMATGIGSVVRENSVVTSSVVAGTGLTNSGTGGFCMGNAVRGFTTAYSGCTHATGNLPAN